MSPLPFPWERQELTYEHLENCLLQEIDFHKQSTTMF